MTDKDLVKELRQMAFIMNRMGDFRKESILNQAGMRLEELSNDSHETAILKFKSALLKKIFPYGSPDKRQYSINSYAVERAIIETEVHHESKNP